MIWTTMKPDRPGWYWYRREPESEEVVEVVLCVNLWACTLIPELVEHVKGEWSSEPIPEPKEPA